MIYIAKFHQPSFRSRYLTLYFFMHLFLEVFLNKYIFECANTVFLKVCLLTPCLGPMQSLSLIMDTVTMYCVDKFSLFINLHLTKIQQEFVMSHFPFAYEWYPYDAILGNLQRNQWLFWWFDIVAIPSFLTTYFRKHSIFDIQCCKTKLLYVSILTDLSRAKTNQTKVPTYLWPKPNFENWNPFGIVNKKRANDYGHFAWLSEKFPHDWCLLLFYYLLIAFDVDWPRCSNINFDWVTLTNSHKG